MTDTETFNLLDEPWILCMDSADNRKALSIRDIFSGQDDARKIVGDSPTQDYAVIRLLLAIFWRAHAQELAELAGGRRKRASFDWGEWFAEKRDELCHTKRDQVVLDYLDAFTDRFDLLSETVPFMQVADLHSNKGETRPIVHIVPEAADDHFTMRTAKGRQAISLAEAARWLVHLQAYDYAGIKTGVVGDPRVKDGKGFPIGTGWTGRTGGTLVLGTEGLLETLLLNTPMTAVMTEQGTNPIELDKPVWEREPDTAAQRRGSDDKLGAVPQGAADLATWQARRVRLVTEEGQVTRVLVSNGDRIPDNGKNVMDDPMTPYQYNPKQSKVGQDAYYARPYDPTQTMWRALDALVAVEDDPGVDQKKAKALKRPSNLSNLAALDVDGYLNQSTFDIALVSMEYGPKKSSVATTFSTTIGLPLVVLREDDLGRQARNAVRTAAQKTYETAASLGWFEGQLRVAAGDEYEFGVKSEDRFYAQLEPDFIAWMQTTSVENADSAQINWQERVRTVAVSHAMELLRGAGMKAIIGREVDAGEDGKGRIVSAGSLFQQLQWRFDKNLPLTGKSTRNQNPSSLMKEGVAHA
ncbi:type I-E CRISPR-associated protein Cse1/CasA [Corynebacterium sp. KPL2895]|jgi:CRISPR system CASCADE complex protein casA|uniref:type I-E CRISPR-associated protein Cse1/CasA n=1 Tax=Corynebacterium sp. KPL2895 TaxID=3158320 RepID=UPI0032EE2B3D